VYINPDLTNWNHCSTRFQRPQKWLHTVIFKSSLTTLRTHVWFLATSPDDSLILALDTKLPTYPYLLTDVKKLPLSCNCVDINTDKHCFLVSLLLLSGNSNRTPDYILLQQIVCCYFYS